MDQKHAEEFIALLEGMRENSNPALVDAVQHGFALTEGFYEKHAPAWMQKMTQKIGNSPTYNRVVHNPGKYAAKVAGGAASTLGAIGTAAAIGAGGYALANNMHGDDAQRMEKRVQVDQDLISRGWTEQSANWDGKTVNGRDIGFYQQAVKGLDNPHLTVSPDGKATYNVLTGEAYTIGLDGQKKPISIADAYKIGK